MNAMRLVAVVGVMILGLTGCGHPGPSIQATSLPSDTLSAKRLRATEGMVRKITDDSVTIGVFGPGADETFKITSKTVFSYRQSAQWAPKFSDLKKDDVVEIGYRDSEPGVAVTVMVSMNGYRR